MSGLLLLWGHRALQAIGWAIRTVIGVPLLVMLMVCGLLVFFAAQSESSDKAAQKWKAAAEDYRLASESWNRAHDAVVSARASDAARAIDAIDQRNRACQIEVEAAYQSSRAIERIIEESSRADSSGRRSVRIGLLREALRPGASAAP